jgi:hypothetical protein
MAICSWCRKEYSGMSANHLCYDGTTFSQRILKTPAEILEEHARQDRIRFLTWGQKVLPEKEDSLAMRLPNQPNTGDWFRWTYDDLKYAAALRVKLTGEPI